MLIGVDEGGVVPPDPFALFELSRDVRPPDYAATFARQVLTLAALGSPLTVSARWRPPWLEAAASEPGVVDASIEDAARGVRPRCDLPLAPGDVVRELDQLVARRGGHRGLGDRARRPAR